jgi:hypothetical protein
MLLKAGIPAVRCRRQIGRPGGRALLVICNHWQDIRTNYEKKKNGRFYIWVKKH